MNLSLKRRIGLSFILANLCVLILAAVVFYCLHSFSEKAEVINNRRTQVARMTDEIRISAIRMMSTQGKIHSKKATETDILNMKNYLDNLHSQLQKLDSLYDDSEIDKVISKIDGLVESLQIHLNKVSLFGAKRDTTAISTIAELSNKIMEDFTNFLDLQYSINEKSHKRMSDTISETKKYMLGTLIISFFFLIILSMAIPGKIALPFKKINDAVRELQECNFDVSIYYDQNDEIGELSRELNKMINSLKSFEELRADRISVEKRKFDILANTLKKNVLVANAEGELIYLNNQMYHFLEVESEDVLSKNMSDTIIPNSIKEAYELALKRKSKIENSEIKIFERKKTDEEQDPKVLFDGFANVFPIRGKESALDYYLMIISEEVFA